MKWTVAASALISGWIGMAQAGPRIETSFDSSWRFARGDIEGAEQLAADDRGWSSIHVPQDCSITGPFDPDAPAGGCHAGALSGAIKILAMASTLARV